MRKKKKNKVRFTVFVLVMVVLLGGLTYGTISIIKSRLKTDGEKVLQSGDKYILSLDYEKTGVSQLDQEVDAYISQKKNDFFEEIKDKTPQEGTTFDLIAAAERADYGETIFLHLYEFEYTGGANYVQNDKTFIYDTKDNKFINIIDLLNEPSDLDRLSTITKEYVTEHFEIDRKDTFSSQLVEQGTAPKVENYENVSLSEDGMKIYYPPYSVGCRADGNVEVLIPLDKLKDILKERYGGKIQEEPKEPEKVVPVVQGRDLSQFEGKKLVAITFDDGPNLDTTIPLVDALEEFDAKVTFFVLGSRVKSHQDALRYAYEHGHQIGSHTYNHLDLTKLDEATLKNEIERTDKKIEEILGVKPAVMRPPYGSKDEFVSEKSGKPLIFWNVDTLDWKTRDSKAIEKEILASTSDGAIVLLHDVYQTSVDGCINALKKLKEQGYAFVTVDEMAKLKGVELTAGEHYYSM